MTKNVGWFVFVLRYILLLEYVCGKCPTLPNPVNGLVTIRYEHYDKMTAMYTCIDGYKRKGNEARTCDYGYNWNGREPTCEPECICDKQRAAGQVPFPLSKNTDILTMAEFDKYVKDKEYLGVWELHIPDNIPNHFGLHLTIAASNQPGVFRRLISFDNARFIPGTTVDGSCENFTSTTMHAIHGFENLAVLAMLLGGDPDNTRLVVHFSSCPDKYVWEIQCFEQFSVTLDNGYCPWDKTLVWVKVKAERTAMDGLSLIQMEKDLYHNTGLNLCQLSNMKSFYILGENGCTTTCPTRFLIP